MAKNVIPVAFTLGILLYGLLGAYVRRAIWPAPIPNASTDPYAWRAQVLPQLLAIELYLQVGVVVLAALLLQVAPATLKPTMTTGFVLGVVLYSVVFFIFDLFVYLTPRRIQRRNAAAPPQG